VLVARGEIHVSLFWGRRALGDFPPGLRAPATKRDT